MPTRYRRRRYRRRPVFRYRRRRRWHRYRRPFRRRWHRRRRPVRYLYQTQPRKRKIIVCRGWEILGIIGSHIEYKIEGEKGKEKPRIYIQNPVPTNKQVVYMSFLIPNGLNNKCDDTWQTRKEWNTKDSTDLRPDKDSPTYWDFCGGFGFANFTFEGLILRNMLGFNRFSEDIRGYTWIRFLGFSFELIPAVDIDYLFRVEQHRGTQDWETNLLHPVNLLNMPFVTWVKSIKRSKCCKPVRLRRRPPPDLHDWYDIEGFRKLLLATYQWTVFDSNNPMGKNPNITIDNKKYTWWDDSWMRMAKWGSAKTAPKKPAKIGINQHLKWWDRGTYDTSFVTEINKGEGVTEPTSEQNWWEWIWGLDPSKKSVGGKTTPFLPPIMPSEHINTIWIRYKFKFQVGGSSIGRNGILWPIREADDSTTLCNPEKEICEACIKEGDLDDTGILTEEAYKRITGSSKRKKRKLVEELAKSILKRKRKRVRWEDEAPDPGPPHPDPKRKVLEYIRYLATRGR
ncbi:ORF1 [Giant panda anellovirus]|uniref:Capsid protein n=1 Tax=Giant panda anellovirus TaxID=2016460 RepID=A0A220IGJ0_9VIRU|nr:ORF1 [Giant panda anellovirus]ASH99102.1 ORF1 [Giant panda anellovirus]